MDTRTKTDATRSPAIADVKPPTALRSLGALRSLVVHFDAGPRAEARLRVARSLAQRHDATVTAVYAATPAAAQLPISIEGAAIGPAYTFLAELDRQRRDDALARFQAVRAEPGAPVEWQEEGGVTLFRSFARRALHADLLVLGQHEPRAADVGVPADFVESIVIQSGTPALVVPYIPVRKTIGTRVVVAWKETAASARALRAALPMLQLANEVHVVSWREEGDDTDPNAVASYLSRHGVDSRVHDWPEKGGAIGDRLLSLASDVSADLLVMGCYGHSRARELVLGGVTRTLLRSMTLPVLMAH